MILKFPLSHTVNQSFGVVRGNIIKSSVSRIFDQKVAQFKIINFRQLEKINSEMKQMLKNGYVIRCDTYFIFHKKRIIGKKNQIKPLDSNNRIKPAIDGLIKCLIDIDDKDFFSGFYEKICCENEREEQVIFKFSYHKIRNLDELMVSLKQ